MSKFKVGDKVVSSDSFCDVYVGEVCTVSELLEYTRFNVVEHPELVMCSKKWELQEPQFKNMKFRVSSPEHSKEIQDALFEMGYKWASGNKEVLYTHESFLYTDDIGTIMMGSLEDTYKDSPEQEHTVEVVKSYKLIPVVPKPEKIEIDGKTYDKEAVLKRLAELETTH